jgi:hypothetical protein
MFGGLWSDQMESISEQLTQVQLIVLFGRSEALLQTIRARAASKRNEAVFEVVDVLTDLLEQVDSASPAMISMERPFVSG